MGQTQRIPRAVIRASEVAPGKIFHVKTSGTDTPAGGSFASPWKTLAFVGCGAGTACRRWDNPALKPGTMPYLIYAGDGVAEPNGLPLYDAPATAAAPIAVLAYPGARVVIGSASSTYGIGNYNGDCTHWSFSRLVVSVGNAQGAITGFRGGRIVANEVTNAAGGCADGQSGAITAGGQGGKDHGGVLALGNYIHDWGCESTSKLEHVFYMSNRGGTPIDAFELGWNYLRDNKAHHGLHVYDEGICGDLKGTLRIHDNVVVNQVGDAVGVSSGGTTDPCFSMPVEIYNNLFINAGLDVSSCETGSNHNYLLGVGGANNRSHVKLYNNTV